MKACTKSTCLHLHNEYGIAQYKTAAFYPYMPRYFVNTHKGLPVLANGGLLKNNMEKYSTTSSLNKGSPSSMSAGCQNYTQLKQTNKTSYASWIWDDGYKWVNTFLCFALVPSLSVSNMTCNWLCCRHVGLTYENGISELDRKAGLLDWCWCFTDCCGELCADAFQFDREKLTNMLQEEHHQLHQLLEKYKEKLLKIGVRSHSLSSVLPFSYVGSVNDWI